MSIKDYMSSRKVSRQTIYNRIEKGLIETLKEGNKLYIVKERAASQKRHKTSLNNINADEIEKYMSIAENTYETLKGFDYNFIKTRLSSIEKAFINFQMEASKKDEKLSKIVSSSLESIENRLISMETRLETIESIIREKFSNIDMKIEQNISIGNEDSFKLIAVDKKIDQLNERLDEIMKKSENNKKSLNPFKR